MYIFVYSKLHIDCFGSLWLLKGSTDLPVTFASWMVYSMPVSLALLTAVIVWLQFFYLGPR